jgi:uncharacterized protein (DUF2147 family)
MKKTILSLIAILCLPLFLYSQESLIKGTWYNEEKSSTITIEEDSNGRYSGKITWLEEPNENGKPKVDKDNPDTRLKERPLMGLIIVENFRYDSGKSQWIEGRIYDPKNGKTYDCFAWVNEGDDNHLYLKGYVAGIRALGRKTRWSRKLQ